MDRKGGHATWFSPNKSPPAQAQVWSFNKVPQRKLWGIHEGRMTSLSTPNAAGCGVRATRHHGSASAPCLCLSLQFLPSLSLCSSLGLTDRQSIPGISLAHFLWLCYPKKQPASTKNKELCAILSPLQTIFPPSLSPEWDRVYSQVADTEVKSYFRHTDMMVSEQDILWGKISRSLHSRHGNLKFRISQDPDRKQQQGLCKWKEGHITTAHCPRCCWGERLTPLLPRGTCL